MSTGDPRNRTRVVRQAALFGSTDVLCLYAENGRIRTNRLHYASDAQASAVVRQTRQLERAELVKLPDSPLQTCRCPRCGRTGSLDTDFGTRVLAGRRQAQSCCRAWRSRRQR